MADNSALDWLRAQANQPTEPFDPIGNLKRNVQGALSTVAAVPGNIQRLVTDPSEYIKNLPTPTMEQMAGAFNPSHVGSGMAGVVKPVKGGAWLDASVNKYIDHLRPEYSLDDMPAFLQRIAKWKDEISKGNDSEHLVQPLREYEDLVKRLPAYDAMHSWLDKNLRNYIKNEMGTPFDPLRKLADEKGKTHLTPQQLEDQPYLGRVQKFREKSGMPVQGMAKTPTGKSWEDTADMAIEYKPASQYQNRRSWVAEFGPFAEDTYHTQEEANAANEEVRKQFEALAQTNPRGYEILQRQLKENPPQVYQTGPLAKHSWIANKDPNEIIYHIEDGAGLNFDSVRDTLLNDMIEGNLQPSSLKNVSVSQAVARHQEAQAEAAAKAEKMAAEQAKKNLSADVYKEYPTGHKWIKLPDPTASKENMEFVNNVGTDLGLCTQHEWAARDYGNSQEGKQLYALIDPKGRPHLQAQTQPAPFEKEHWDKIPRDDQINISKEINKWAQGLDYRPTPIDVRAMTGRIASEFGYEPPVDLTELKPPSNSWEGQFSLDREQKYSGYKDTYQPFLDDFVKSGNWNEVSRSDLNNTSLAEIKPNEQANASMIGLQMPRFVPKEHRYMLQDQLHFSSGQPVPEMPKELEQYKADTPVNSGPATGSPDGTQTYKKGGAVRKYAKGGEVTIDPPPVSDVSDITEDLSKPYFGNPHLQAQGQTALANAEQRSPLTLADPKTYAAVRTALSVPVNTANLLAGGVKAVGQSIPEAIRTGQAPAPLAEDIAAKYFKENPGMQPNTPMSQEYAGKIEDLMDKAHLPPVIGDLLFAGKANEAFAPVKTMAADYLRANPPSVGLAMKGVDKLEDVIKPEDRIQVKPAEEPAAKPSKTLSQAIQNKTNGVSTPSDIDEPPVGLIKSRVNHEDVGVQPEVLDQPVTIDMKKGDLTQHNLLTTREERETAQRTVLSQEEKDIIRDGAKASGVPMSEIEAKVRKHKSDNPTVGDEPWAPLQVSRIVPNPKKAGDYDIEYKTVPYSFERDTNDNLIKPNTPEYDTHTQTLAEKLKDEVRQIYDRFKGGDEAAGSIIRQAGWYKEMRSRLRQEFGGLGDTFADLLGATSPNTPVRENWKNAVDLLRKASAGEFDHLVPQWENWYDNVNTLEKKAQDIFDAKYAEGKTKKAIKEDPEFMDVMKQLKEAREFPDELLPLKDTGAKYGFNGQNAVRALLDLFRVVKNPNADIGIGATAPKAITFSGNLIGFKDRATIDVWAARLLQRLAGKIRVPSMAESGVNGAMLPDGTTTGQFGLGQDVFHKAVDMIRNDPEMSKLDVLKNISDDDLQALVWFKEKELWTKKNWTSSAGEGGSFEQEADLAGIKNQEEVNRLRKMIDTSVSVTKDVKDAAQQVLDHVEDLRTLKKVAKDDLTAQDMAEIDKQIKDLNEDRPKLKAILAKPTVEELKEIKKGAAQELSQMSRPLERFQAGISPQRPEFVPTNEDMASIGNDLKDAIHTDDNKASVMGSKVLSTEGRYGDPERSIDLEAVVRDGFNPNPLLKELVSKAQKYDQDSTFLSRVLRHDETPDPLIHRPGVEIYFKDSKAVDKLQPMLDELAKEGINFYTVVVDGRRSTKAMHGFMPPAVGVRFQLVPEFEQRYGMFDWSKLTDEEIAAKVESEADQMDKLAARVAKAIPGVSDAQQFWYDTEVLFKNQYQEKLNALENANRTPSGENPQAGARVWSGQPIRSGVEAATRWSSEAGGEEANVQHGNDERPQEVKPEVNRIDMNFKDVTKRIPELTEAAKKVASGTMSREEYSDLVDKYKPITPFSFVPKPASVDEAMSALTANKKPMYGKTSEIPKGEVVDGRLDIPAYKDHGVWVNSVHRKGEPTVYGNVTYLKNGQMIPETEKALKVAQGGPKAPFAVIRGEWEPIGEKPAIKMAQEALNSPDWVQAGYDPERHGFYYNRKTKEPITHFDESLQIGPLVLVKGAKNLSKPGEFKYKKGGAVHISNDRNTMWIDIQNRKFKGK